MHPYVVDHMVQERQQEVARLRRHAAPADVPVPGWRHTAGRALVALGVAFAVPAAQREAARRQAAAVLCAGR